MRKAWLTSSARPLGVPALAAAMVVAAISAGASSSSSLSTASAEAPSREYQVKAAFLYNFTQFVEWPGSSFASGDAPLVIGVAGPSDPFEGALEQAMAGKTAGHRPIVVKHFESPAQLEPCHLLFVPHSREDWLPKASQAQGGRPCLTVGETDDLMEKGGTIAFFTEDGKLRFEVNEEAVEKAGLKVSSKLLKLAKIRGK